MNTDELNSLLTAIYGDLDDTEDTETSCTINWEDSNPETPDGINLHYRTKVRFNSGDRKALRRFFTTRINKCYLSVELCRDVVPDYFPKQMGGNLHLKDPIYTASTDYSRLQSFLCSTYNNQIDGSFDITTSSSTDLNQEINHGKFEEAFTKYSWSSYPRALPKQVHGSLIVDGGHLTDLNGLPRIIGSNESLRCLWLKNYDSRVIDLTEFKFGSLILEECCFEKLIGLPEVMDVLIIKEGRKYENGNLKYKPHFNIKFPKIINEKLVIHSQGFASGRQPTYNIGDMHVYGNVSLRNVYVDGNLYNDDRPDGLLMLSPTVELVNVNVVKGKPFSGNLTVFCNKGAGHLRVENSNIPEFNTLYSDASIIICKNLKTANLPENEPLIAGKTMIFDDCSSNVIRAFSKNKLAKSRVKILGIMGDFEANDSIDLTDFTNLSALLINGQQQDVKNIDTKPLSFKLPYVKPMDEKDSTCEPSVSDLFFPNMTQIFLGDSYTVRVWEAEYSVKFMEAHIIKDDKRSDSYPLNRVVISNLLPFTLDCNWEAIKDVRYDLERVKLHNPFPFSLKMGSVASGDFPTLLVETFSLDKKYKTEFEALVRDGQSVFDGMYLNLFENFVTYLDTMKQIGKPITDVAPLAEGVITYEVIQKWRTATSGKLDFTKWVLQMFGAKVNRLLFKSIDTDYLDNLLRPVFDEKVCELTTQMTIGGF